MTTAISHADGKPLRILWVKVGGLWPVNTGGRLRSFHLIKALSQRHQVTVLTTHRPEEESGALARELSGCRQVVSLPHAAAKHDSARFKLALLRSWLSPLPVDLWKSRVAALQQRVGEELASGNHDLCVADFLSALPNVPEGGTTPVVLFEHNVEYMIWRRLCTTSGNLLKRALLEVEWRKMRRYEHRACHNARLTVAVSAEDCEQLRRGAPQGNFSAIPTGVDLEYFSPAVAGSEQPLELVFTGSMDWHPNEDAMLYFFSAILPLIRREFPRVTLTVVGRNPSAQLRAVAQGTGVIVTGTVPDVRPYISAAAVYVVPLRVGGGTRLKIYEALAMGKAVVSTTIGAEGLPLTEGLNVVRADTAADFAAAVVALLRDPARREALGFAGRSLMERFGWSGVAADFERLCQRALQANANDNITLAGTPGQTNTLLKGKSA